MFGNCANISGFTIRGATGDGAAGIYLGLGANYCNIADNIVSNNDVGTSTYHPNNNTFAKNTVSSNDYDIRLYQSNSNSITCNGVCNNAQRGLYLFLFSRDNDISYNNIIANGAQQADGSYQWQFDNAQSNSVVAEQLRGNRGWVDHRSECHG